MPTTLRNTDILFNDGSTQSTAAGAVSTTSVLNATAGASAGAVGTYALITRAPLPDTSSPGSGLNAGATVAGSSWFYSDGLGIRLSTTALSGTWRLMGANPASVSGDSYSGYTTRYYGTVALRIS